MVATCAWCHGALPKYYTGINCIGSSFLNPFPHINIACRVGAKTAVTSYVLKSKEAVASLVLENLNCFDSENVFLILLCVFVIFFASETSFQYMLPCRLYNMDLLRIRGHLYIICVTGAKPLN